MTFHESISATQDKTTAGHLNTTPGKSSPRVPETPNAFQRMMGMGCSPALTKNSNVTNKSVLSMSQAGGFLPETISDSIAEKEILIKKKEIDVNDNLKVVGKRKRTRTSSDPDHINANNLNNIEISQVTKHFKATNKIEEKSILPNTLNGDISPPLFDSEDGRSNSPPVILEETDFVPVNRGIYKESKVRCPLPFEGDTVPQVTSVGKRPLFKPRSSEEIQSEKNSSQLEQLPSTEQNKRKINLSRLSRRRSSVGENLKKEKESYKKSDNVDKLCTEACVNEIKEEKDEAPVEDNNCDDLVIKTKRKKRRSNTRMAPKKTVKGVVYDDELEVI